MGSALFIETYSNETCEEWEKIELHKFTYSGVVDDVHFVRMYYEFDPIERAFQTIHFLVLDALQHESFTMLLECFLSFLRRDAHGCSV